MKEGWEIKKLGEVGAFQRGGGFLKSDYVEDGFPCIHYGQIHTRFGVKAFNHLTCIPEELALSKSKIAHNGDIIIAITSEDVDGSCKCTAWMGDYDVAVGGHAAIYRHTLNPAFVAYYFRGGYFQAAKKVFAHGSKVVEIKPNDIAKIKIAYPPFAEQEKIVAELDCLSGIIEKKKQQLKEYDALAQSIFYEMFGDPVENERKWEFEQLGKVCLLKAGKAIKASELSQNFITGLYPCFGGNGIRGYIAKISHNNIYPIIGRQGALCGNVVLSTKEFYATEHAVVVQPLIDMNVVWLYYTLMFMNLNRLAQGVAQPGLSVSKVNQEYIPLPPLALQQEFASKIEAIEKQKALIKKSIEEVETLFNSRMDQYFN